MRCQLRHTLTKLTQFSLAPLSLGNPAAVHFLPRPPPSYNHQYGPIRSMPFVRASSTSPERQTKTYRIGYEEALSHWRPAVSQIFEGLLVEAVGETGEGGFVYPAVQRYLRRCGRTTHRVGAGTHDEDCGSDDDSDLHWNGGTRRERRPAPPDDGDWTSSSADDGDEDDDERLLHGHARDETVFPSENGDGRGLVRSRRPPMFVRTPIYFAELLALGRVLYAVPRGGRCGASDGGRRGGSFAGTTHRARRQALAYCLTVVRMCCDAGSGGLDNAEPAVWGATGGRELDEDAATLQRAQLLVDTRLPEKIASCLHDSDSDVRRDAVCCALSALQGGHSRLRWVSLSAREVNERSMDPRALLALGFCSTVWVSGLVAFVRGRGAPAMGSANPSRALRDAEEMLRRNALKCLTFMAAAGDLATRNWRGIGVICALQGVLSRVGAGAMDVTPTFSPVKASRGSAGGAAGLSMASGVQDWKKNIMEALQALVENGSAETLSMLRAAHPRFGAMLRMPTEFFSPKAVVATATDLLKGGTLDELISLVRRARSILATAVRIGDRQVLGDAVEEEIPEDIRVTFSLIWGWMQRALVQVSRDEPDHPSTAARVSLSWECLELMRFLLCCTCPEAFRLVHCKVHPVLALEVYRASGGTCSPVVGSREQPNKCQVPESRDKQHETKVELAAARTGLEAIVLLLSARGPTSLDLYRLHPLPPLAAGAADALADALTYGDRQTVDSLADLGLGLRLGLMVEITTTFVRESRRLGVEDIHLLWTYPAGRRARVKLLDRVLWRAHRGLHEQVIISGLVEFIVSNMLPDCGTTDIVSARLPASFVRYNGTPLVRNEGLSLLERVVARCRRAPAVTRETARQTLRHALPSAEYGRLRRHRHRSIRAGVSACLRCLARLNSPPVDTALTVAGVPRRAIFNTRRDHTASKTRRQWTRWLRREAGDASASSVDVSRPRQPNPVGRLAGSAATSSIADATAHSHPQTPSNSDLGLGKTARLSRYSPRTMLMPGSKSSKGRAKQAKKTTRWAGTSYNDTSADRASLSDTDAEDRGQGEDSDNLRLGQPSVATMPQDTKGVTLTIEGDLSALSVPDLVGLLAAELGAVKEGLTVVEVGVSPTVGHPTRLSPIATTPPSVATPGVVNNSALKVLLPEPLADQLYTRCLAGVLRVPGLLYLEVRLSTERKVALCHRCFFEEY